MCDNGDLRQVSEVHAYIMFPPKCTRVLYSPIQHGSRLWKYIQYGDKLHYLLDRAILLKLSLKFGLRRVVVLQKNIGKL